MTLTICSVFDSIYSSLEVLKPFTEGIKTVALSPGSLIFSTHTRKEGELGKFITCVSSGGTDFHIWHNKSLPEIKGLKVQAIRSVQLQSASRDLPVPPLQVEDKHFPSNSPKSVPAESGLWSLGYMYINQHAKILLSLTISGKRVFAWQRVSESEWIARYFSKNSKHSASHSALIWAITLLYRTCVYGSQFHLTWHVVSFTWHDTW